MNLEHLKLIANKYSVLGQIQIYWLPRSQRKIIIVCLYTVPPIITKFDFCV